jgi:DNA-directed RNA polymerase subunit H (RpoH/RPB5)
MSLFKNTVAGVKRNKQRREQGKSIAIPFPFPKFAEYIPGIQQGRYIIVTANSKVGKSKIADYVFTYNPVNYVLNNPHCGLDVKIDVFSLEMSKQEKMKQFIAHNLYLIHGISLSEEEIDSIFDRYILEDDILRKIEALEPIAEEFESKVTYIDHTKNPTGIYKHVREYYEQNGHYVDKDNKNIPLRDIYNDDKELSAKARFAIDRYIPYNPDMFYIVHVDHVGLFTLEKRHKNIREAISDFSSNYCIKMRDRWKAIIVAVQQQAASQEGVENMKLSMTKPSANGLGENKTTQRDADMILGLYAPVRYKIKTYENYNIANANSLNEPLLEYHRELFTIMNRRGRGNVSTQLFFHGAVNYFKELPDPSNGAAMDQVNNLVRNLKQLTYNG